MASDSFLSIVANDNFCLLCQNCFKPKENVRTCGQTGWQKLQSCAREWAQINVPSNDERYYFCKVDNTISDKCTAFGKVHHKCRTYFISKIHLYQKKYPTLTCNPQSSISFDNNTNNSHRKNPLVKTRAQGPTTNIKRICFVCDSTRLCDSNAFNNGGLGRCGYERSQEKIKKSQEFYLNNVEHKYYRAANRLLQLESGQSFDLYAIDVYYHQSCYRNFTRFPMEETNTTNAEEKTQHKVLDVFLATIRLRILHKREAYLLHALMKDLNSYCSEYSISPIWKSTKQLKQYLMDTLGNEISFFPHVETMSLYILHVLIPVNTAYQH